MVNPRYHQLPSIICMNPKNPRYSVVPQVLFSWLIAQAALLVSKSWQILFTSSWRASGQALNKMGGRKCCWAVGPYPGYIYIYMYVILYYKYILYIILYIYIKSIKIHTYIHIKTGFNTHIYIINPCSIIVLIAIIWLGNSNSGSNVAPIPSLTTG